MDNPEQPTEFPEKIIFPPASLQQRFSAFLMDLIINGHLLVLWALGFQYFMQGSLSHPFSFKGNGLFVFCSTSAALHLLYFFFFEGVLTTTPGKALAGIFIQKKKGGMPSLIAIFIRNFFRFVDYPCVLFTGVSLMEGTQHHQRLGDILSGMVVVSKTSFGSRCLDLQTLRLAGITRRCLAFFIDLIIFIPFLYGLFLAIPVSRPFVSKILLALVPTISFFYVTFFETIFQTTAGKALMGMKVISEDGRPARFASLFLRQLLRILDTNPLGYLCVVISSKKQRLGDLMSGTLVVLDRKGLRGWLSLPLMIFISAAVAYGGFRQSDNFLKMDRVLKVGRYRMLLIPDVIRYKIFGNLYIENITLAKNENQTDFQSSFEPGDVVYIRFFLSGYQINDEMASLQTDLVVYDSNNTVILNLPEAIHSTLPVGQQKSAQLIIKFILHPNALPGRYKITLTAQDYFGKQEIQKTEFFTLQKKL